MTAALVEAVRDGWAWAGVEVEAVTAVSPFGHLILRDRAQAFWYLDPEVRTLERVAQDEAQLFAYMQQVDVREIWEAQALVDAAKARLGEPEPGQCYSLKPLALLQGDYAAENLWTISVAELTRVTGNFERQTQSLPDGAQVQLKVVE